MIDGYYPAYGTESVELSDRKKYTVIGHFIVGGVKIPMVDIPQQSDYEWQLDCLRSRLEHPEYYEGTEDIHATITRIQARLRELERSTSE